MVGNIPSLTKLVSGTSTVPQEVLYIPLQFWFNRNPGLALPLIALQYHEVKVNIEFRNRDDCYYSDDTSLSWGSSDFEASLFVDYIYLDTDERRRFAQVSHEYLLFSKRSKAATRQHADPVGAKKCRLSAWPQPLSCAPQMAICCC